MVEPLEGELRSLLGEHVDSYEKLDIVLFVRGKGEPVHVREIAHVLRLAVGQVERTVAALCASGLLVRHAGELVCESARESLRCRLNALATAYYARPLAVLTVLSRQALLGLRARAPRARVKAARRQAGR